jgi:hypothetical protein
VVQADRNPVSLVVDRGDGRFAAGMVVGEDLTDDRDRPFLGRHGLDLVVVTVRCDSQDLTLQAMLSNGVVTVRQTLRRMFSAMAAERAKKRRKFVLTPVNNS